MFLAPRRRLAAFSESTRTSKRPCFPVPDPTADSTRAITEYNDSFSVNAKSPNQDAALKLVDFLAQPDQQKAYAKIQGEISVPDSVTGTVPDLVQLVRLRCSRRRKRDPAVARLAEPGRGNSAYPGDARLADRAEDHSGRTERSRQRLEQLIVASSPTSREPTESVPSRSRQVRRRSGAAGSTPEARRDGIVQTRR